MSLTTFSFFVFLFITFILYYTIRPAQKYILLAASLFFYISISSYGIPKMCILIAYMILLTYGGGLLIEKASGKVKGLILATCVTGLVGALFVLKYAYNLLTNLSALFHMSSDFSWFQFAAVIGISYYALSAIGYLIDVYWESYRAERNIVNVGLFIFYFPQLISGPFTRYGEMAPQFKERTKLDYSNVTNGIRRMIWGYFKKLVISERFGIVVATVYGDYHSYSMIGIAGATLCYAIQLYTDFSGCMDIIMGASELFGIKLPENFRAPFFSQSIQEFWQRWHITLGTWFKDYLMYPVQKSKALQTIGKKAKKKFGKKAGKKIPFYLSMLLLWILIGIWHGATGYYFIASAGIPCVLLLLSDFCQPLFAKLVKGFKINTECESWKWFRRIRTLLLICICWVVACSNGTNIAVDIFKHMFTHIWSYTPMTTALATFGLSTVDILLMTLGVVLLYLSDLCIEKGTTIFKKIDEQNFFIKVAIIYIEILVILFHGMVGSSAFIYFQF